MILSMGSTVSQFTTNKVLHLHILIPVRILHYSVMITKRNTNIILCFNVILLYFSDYVSKIILFSVLYSLILIEITILYIIVKVNIHYEIKIITQCNTINNIYKSTGALSNINIIFVLLIPRFEFTCLKSFFSETKRHTFVIVCLIFENSIIIVFSNAHITLNIDSFIMYYESLLILVLYVCSIVLEMKFIFKELCHAFFPRNIHLYIYRLFVFSILRELNILVFHIMKHNYPLSFAHRHFCTYTFCHTQPTRLQIIIFSATIYILVQCFSEGSALVKVIITIIVVIHVHVQIEQHKHIYTVAFICSKIGCVYQYMSHIINKPVTQKTHMNTIELHVECRRIIYIFVLYSYSIRMNYLCQVLRWLLLTILRFTTNYFILFYMLTSFYVSNFTLHNTPSRYRSISNYNVLYYIYVNTYISHVYIIFILIYNNG